MKRLRHRPTPELLQPKEQMPMAEGIVALKKNGHRNWASIGDDELITFAQKFVDEKGIRTRLELTKMDEALYHVLKRRGLSGRVRFEADKKAWYRYTDDELVSYAQKFVDEKGVRNRHGLEKTADGLYQTLHDRKLIDRVKFQVNERAWSKYSDDALVARAQGFVDERGIKNIGGLAKADGSLYGALLKRNLVDSVRFERQRRETRDWASMDDEKLVTYTQRLIDEMRMTHRVDLQKAKGGLYDALTRRKLLERITFEKGRRAWASMSDDEIVEFARKFIEEKGITGRKGLARADGGFYEVLRKRHLISRVFAPLEAERKKQAVQQVFDGLKEFEGK